MNYKIRKLKEEDIPVVIKQEDEIFHEYDDMLEINMEINPFMYYFVLEIDSQIAGFIGLSIIDNAEIHKFYVIPEYRRMGFGEMLLKFVIDLCSMSHILNLTLEVRKSNLPALNLYKKLQFKIVAERESYYRDGEDAYLMLKEFEVKG